MGDSDQIHCPFPYILSVQIGNSIFSDDIMNITSCYRGSSTLRKGRSNPGYLTPVRRGLYGKNDFAVAG